MEIHCYFTSRHKSKNVVQKSYYLLLDPPLSVFLIRYILPILILPATTTARILSPLVLSTETYVFLDSVSSLSYE